MTKKFKEIIDDGIEGIYWKPHSIGTQIEGKIVAINEGEYGLQVTINTSEDYEIELPAHKNLQRKLIQIKEGDYIRATLTNIRKSRNEEYSDQYIYKLEVVIEEENGGELDAY